MSFPKKSFLAAAAIIIVISLGAVYVILSGVTFLDTLVVSKVQDAFMSAGGYELQIAQTQGNPITGVYGKSVDILHGETVVATADDIELKLNLTTLLAPSPKLTKMQFSNLQADLGVILQHLPESGEESSGPPALERLFLENSQLATPYGALDIKRAILALSSTSYRLQFDGLFDNAPLEIKGRVNNRDGVLSLEDTALKWKEATAELEGGVRPKLSLGINIGGLDVDRIAETFPVIKNATLSGTFSGRLLLTDEDGLTAAGSFSADKGKVWKFPFSQLSADVAYRGSNIAIENIEAHLGEAGAAGAINVGLPSTDNGNPLELGIKMKVESFATKTLIEDFPWLEQIEGTFDEISCDISGPLNKLGGRVELYAQDLNVMDFTAGDIRANLNLKESRLFDTSFSANVIGSVLRGSGSVIIAPDVTFDIKADLEPLNLAALEQKFPAIAENGISGVGTGHASVAGSVGDLVIKGKAVFPELAVKGQLLKNATGEILYSNKGLTLSGASAVWNGVTVTADGNHNREITDVIDELDFSGDFSDADISSFADMAPAIKDYNVAGKMSGSWKVSGKLDSPALSFDIKIPDLTAYNQALKFDTQANGVFAQNNVDLTSFRIERGKSLLTGSGQVTLKPETSFKLDGSFQQINPDFLIDAELVDALLSGDVDGSVSIWKNGTDPIGISVKFDDSKMQYENVYMTSMTGGITLQDDTMTFDSLDSIINSGRVRLDGRVQNISSIGVKSSDVTISVNAQVTSADIGRTSRIFFPDARGYQGYVNVSADIGGTLEDPNFKGGATLYGVRTMGLFLPVMRISDAHGDKNGIVLPEIRAIVGRGRIDASGSIKNSEGEWLGSVNATGRSVDIASLLEPLNESMEDDDREGFAGSLNFDFEGKGSLSGFEGEGTATIAALEAVGMQFRKVKIPFWVSDGYILVEDASAEAYNGKITGQLAKDLDRSDWGLRVEVKSADLEPALKDLMPDSEGTISGVTNLILRIGGDTERTSLSDGSGSLEVVDGEISGFPGAEAVSDFADGRPLRFASAIIPFNLSDKTVFILPGSRVSAPKGDPLFKYIMADGSISIPLDVDLSCIGNVNIRALNSFAGGIQGILDTAVNTNHFSTDTMLQDFIGGAISGFARNEFRDVSLHVVTVSGDVTFDRVQIAKPNKYDLMPKELTDPTISESAKKHHRDEERIQIKLEFPVGPGGEMYGESIGGQVGGQVLEQALKGAFSFW